MVMVIAPEMVPLENIGKDMASITSMFALTSVLDPILGRVINSHLVAADVGEATTQVQGDII